MSLRGDELSLGRDPGSDIVVDAPAVSRRHARLVRRGDTYEIVDEGSTNGLTVAGRRVPRHLLREGDVVAVGASVSLEFRAAEAEAGAAAAYDPGEVAATRGGVVELPEGGAVVLGRGAAADMALDHPQASREHARLSRRGGRVVVEDLGSGTGTFVNGRRVERREL